MSKALELVEEYADAVAKHRLESLYGTSNSYTLEKAKERDEAHELMSAELRRLDAEMQEQCRLLGLSAERELALLAERDARIAELARQLSDAQQCGNGPACCFNLSRIEILERQLEDARTEANALRVNEMNLEAALVNTGNERAEGSAR